jgi:ribosomal protein L7/L12
MRDLGVGLQEVYLAARDNGFDEIEAIEVLRQVFHLSLREAQEAISKAQKELQQHAA